MKSLNKNLHKASAARNDEFYTQPWHEGDKTDPKNCQMLCKQDNRTKSGK